MIAENCVAALCKEISCKFVRLIVDNALNSGYKSSHIPCESPGDCFFPLGGIGDNDITSFGLNLDNSPNKRTCFIIFPGIDEPDFKGRQNICLFARRRKVTGNITTRRFVFLLPGDFPVELFHFLVVELVTHFVTSRS